MARKGKTVIALEEKLIQCYAQRILLEIKKKSEGETEEIKRALDDVDGNFETLRELYEEAHGAGLDRTNVIRLATNLVLEKTGRSPSELSRLLKSERALSSTVDEKPQGKRITPIFSREKVHGVVDRAELPQVNSVEEAASVVMDDVEEITPKQIQKYNTLAKKCKEDFVFFCKTCLEIPYRPGLSPLKPEGGYGPFVPNDGQLKIIAPLIDMWLDGKPVRAIILKSRQLGITTVLLAFWCWLMIQRPYFTVMFIIDKDAHMMEKRDLLLRWFKAISERVEDLPTVQSQGAKVIRLSNSAKILFESSQSPNPGTSEMIHALHCSEKPKWMRGKDVAIDRSILPGISDDKNTFIVDESTADGVNGFYRKWLRVTTGREQGETKTIPLFLPWYLSPEYKKRVPIDFKYNNADSELCEFDEEGTLLFTEQQYAERYLLENEQIYWRRLKIKNDFKGDREAFDKEYPTTPAHAWRSNGSLFFGADTMIQVERSVRDPVFIGHLADLNSNNDPSRIYSFTMYRPCLTSDRNGYLKIYELPEHGEEYVIGGDVAEGIEADPDKPGDPDYTFFVVVNKNTKKVVATYSARIKPEDAALPLLLLALFYKNARVNVERNSVGQTVWAMFKQSGYGKIYVRPGSTSFDDRAWNKTTSGNRKTLLLQLRYYIRKSPEIVVAKDLYEQLQTFAINKDGKPEALPGNHDDGVFALVHAFHMVFEETGVKVVVEEEKPKEPEEDTIDWLFKVNNLEIQWGDKDAM